MKKERVDFAMQFMSDKVEYFQSLTVPQFFGGDVDMGDYPVVEDWCEMNKGEFDCYFHGVSKAALVSEKSNWVVKIPFNSHCLYNYNPEEEGYDYDKPDWYEYCDAGEFGWNYCALELDIYEEVEAAGLGIFLAETRFFCHTANNYPIYIQEKVIAENSWRNSEKINPSKKSLSIAKTIKQKSYTRLSDKWLATAIDFYGEEKVKEFLHYINEVNPRMEEDLHGGNYGYRCSDGSPCLLDFSGWDEDI